MTDDAKVCPCVCVCVSLARDSSETIEVIIIKLTATDMLMHDVLIILILTFIQGHTDLNPENSKCSIISETVHAIHITFAVKIIRLKV